MEYESEQNKKKIDYVKILKEYMKADRLIISQSSKWKAIFDTTILIVIGYSCVTTVYYVAFSAKMSKVIR
jgi:hypothetical protein